MSEDEPQFLNVKHAAGSVRIAYRHAEGTMQGPGIFWLSGLKSDMASTKASFIAQWAQARGLAVTRFDYSGHGASGGAFTDATTGQWLAETLAVLEHVSAGPQILVGSSMGGWIALLVLKTLARRRGRIAGCALIAPAWDMTEELMWKQFPAEARQALLRDGVHLRPSEYGEPYALTRALIEEGRRHLIKHAPFDPGCPVRILQGMRDPDVPWQHALALLELLRSDDVVLELIKDGDHRLSRTQDLERLGRTVGELV